jgi:hypothetical protein
MCRKKIFFLIFRLWREKRGKMSAAGGTKKKKITSNIVRHRAKLHKKTSRSHHLRPKVEFEREKSFAI